jgi:hypothetical protein
MLLVLMVGCGESTGPGRPLLTPSRAVVSAPGDDGFVYVSLPEIGKFSAPVTVANHRIGQSFQTQLVSGGFDPMTIAAEVGDTLWITVNFSAKDSSVTYAVVPAGSQPTIIRTVPADGASDVDVLDSLVAIFSEPVDLSSLASGIHLQPIGASPLTATLSDCAAPWCAKLVPSIPLPGNTQFQFVGSAMVTARSGTVAAQPFAVSFTTGAPTAWPDALGPRPLAIKSFTVIEFQPADDTIHDYAPFLTVLNSGTTSVDIGLFDFTVPGIGSSEWGLCDAITVAPGDSAVLFLADGGLYDVTMGLRGKRATGDATATLQYVSAGYSVNMDLSSVITAGQPSPAEPRLPDRWSPYCP